MYSIEVLNEKIYPIDEARLQQAARTVLEQQNAQPHSSLTIVIEDDEAVATLNQRYRGIDSATDVLSFPADMDVILMPEDEPPYLGDLVIAYAYALAQAQHEGHDANESFALLVVHGTLHLLGYDHDTPENRAAMWAAQAEALTTLNISTAIVPALEGLSHDE